VTSCIEAKVIQLSSLEHDSVLHIMGIIIFFPELIPHIRSLGSVEYLLQTDWTLSRSPAGFCTHSLKLLITTVKLEFHA